MPNQNAPRPTFRKTIFPNVPAESVQVVTVDKQGCTCEDDGYVAFCFEDDPVQEWERACVEEEKRRFRLSIKMQILQTLSSQINMAGANERRALYEILIELAAMWPDLYEHARAVKKEDEALGGNITSELVGWTHMN